ncbi:MAG: T9SS type A sorting domain-containing protein [Flavobacteriaceae bacterium]
MKTLYFLFTAILVTTLSYSQTTELFFSMYGEGSASNNFLEIYNGTGADIDLGAAGYSIELYGRGNTYTSYNLVFSAGTIINNNDVFVIVHPSASPTIKAEADVEHGVCYFDGESSITLSKDGVILDLFGEIGTDPWGAFRVGDYAWGAALYTLIRKPTIWGPNDIPLGSLGTNSSNTEWLVYPINSQWDQIGAHTTTLGVNDYSITSSIKIYPNPGSEKLTIGLSSEFMFKNVKLYNTNGQQLLQSDKLTIDVSNLSTGIYFLEIETNKGKGVKKFIKK